MRVLVGHGSGVRSVCTSVCGRFVLSGGGDKSIRIWDIATGESKICDC